MRNSEFYRCHTIYDLRNDKTGNITETLKGLKIISHWIWSHLPQNDIKLREKNNVINEDEILTIIDKRNYIKLEKIL